MKGKLGVFDSGLGGLIVARAIHKELPQYDYVYLGDTKRVPYGNRSHQTVYEFTKQALHYLFTQENCTLVILACNTASSRALRKIQQEYLPKNFPDRKVLGVLIPAAEVASKYNRIGVLATQGTVESHSFPKEIHKLHKQSKVFQNAAPMLVPLIEEGDMKNADVFLAQYLKPFSNKSLDCLVLGCTHYPILKGRIKKIIATNIKIVSQDEIIPAKLKQYLVNHKEINNKLSKKGTIKILVTDLTENVEKLSKKWFASQAKPKLITL